jgi:hypothetical protein
MISISLTGQPPSSVVASRSITSQWGIANSSLEHPDEA